MMKWADEIAGDGYPKWFPGMPEVDARGFIVERGHPLKGALLEYSEEYKQERARHIARLHPPPTIVWECERTRVVVHIDEESGAPRWTAEKWAGTDAMGRKRWATVDMPLSGHFGDVVGGLLSKCALPEWAASLKKG